MANTKISNLTALGAAPAADDLLVLVDVSASQTKKLTVANLINAVERNANVFTPTVASVPITINMPNSGSADATIWQYNGVQRAYMRVRSDRVGLVFDPTDGGLGSGAFVALGRNSNGSTPSAGYLQMQQGDGDNSVFWVDSSANFRVGTAGPTNATDTSGTVVGTQTSWHDVKESIEVWNGTEALDAIRSLTLYSYRMIKDGQKTPDGDKPTYFGLVITDEDRSNNAWFGLGYANNQIPVLNERNLFGYILAAIRHGGNIINDLQERVAALEAQ